MRLAALDVGTNTIRLLVADVEEGNLVHVARGREITRLGKDVDATHRLDAEASARSLAVIERFVDRAGESGAERVRLAGTSVLRDAEDGADFLEAVRNRTGTTLEIIDGDEEGAIAFLGATWELEAGACVVCDIGGGSTELVTGTDRAEATVSLDIGSVRITERCLRADPPSQHEIEEATRVIDEALERAHGVVDPTGSEQLVGVAGTITTVAALVLGMKRYDDDVVHHSRLGRFDVVAWSDRLLALSAAQIRELGPVIEPARADIIAAGALILRRVMEKWGFDDVLVSERDILDGLVLDLAERIA